jgi:hypothetical protein
MGSGPVCDGPGRGGQYRWAPIEAWLGGPPEELTPDDARAELARHWLARFGPGTEQDVRWWAGWTLGQARQALARIGAVTVELDGGATGYVLPDDAETSDAETGATGGRPTTATAPWVALLPALDPTTMGWADRDWYLRPHRPRLFDTNGNAGPTIWVDGRVVGGWGQRGDGIVVVRLMEDVGREAEGAIEAEAARLTSWLGPARVTPRFRTPTERELSAE